MEIYVGKHTHLTEAESLYDAMYAELFGERKNTRRKPDARTRAERLADWDAEKDRRKDIHLDWVERDSRRRYGHGKTHYWDSNAERKICYAESVARSDWELEQIEIEEDLEYERFNAELFEFDRKWREEAKAEQEHMRKMRKAIEFQEWLKWA